MATCRPPVNAIRSINFSFDQLLSRCSLTGPKARPNSFRNLEIHRGTYAPIPTIDGVEVALRRVKARRGPLSLVLRYLIRGYGGPRTFYSIKKSWLTAEIWRNKVSQYTHFLKVLYGKIWQNWFPGSPFHNFSVFRPRQLVLWLWIALCHQVDFRYLDSLAFFRLIFDQKKTVLSHFILPSIIQPIFPYSLNDDTCLQ